VRLGARSAAHDLVMEIAIVSASAPTITRNRERVLSDGRISAVHVPSIKAGDIIGFALSVDGRWTGEWRGTVELTGVTPDLDGKLTVNGVDILSRSISIGTKYPKTGDC
jgi:hypothetical protein